MALSDVEKLLDFNFLTYKKSLICLTSHSPGLPSLHVAGWYSPVYLFTTLHAIHPTDEIPACHSFVFLSNIPWGHSSVNLTIYLHYIPGYFSPVCLDTCRGVSHLSNHSICSWECRSLPWFESFRQLCLSDWVKILSLSLGLVDPNPNHGHTCNQPKLKHNHSIGGMLGGKQPGRKFYLPGTI